MAHGSDPRQTQSHPPRVLAGRVSEDLGVMENDEVIGIDPETTIHRHTVAGIRRRTSPRRSHARTRLRVQGTVTTPVSPVPMRDEGA